MKHKCYLVAIISIFLFYGSFLTDIKAQSNATKTILNEDDFTTLSAITDRIQERSGTFQCPQFNIDHAKKLAEAIEKTLITLERYKAWIEEGSRPNRNDPTWLAAQSLVERNYFKITETQKKFYVSVSKYILPQNYKGDPGPTAKDPVAAIRYLNSQFTLQVLKLNQLYPGFKISSATHLSSLKLTGKIFKPGELITIEFTSLPCYGEDAWIGIIPSHIGHGNESRNEENKITYRHLGKKTSGSLSFKVPEKPGAYDFRMFDTDDNGNEVASVSFKVVEKDNELINNKPVVTRHTAKWLIHFDYRPTNSQNGIFYAILKPGGKWDFAWKDNGSINIADYGNWSITGNTINLTWKEPGYNGIYTGSMTGSKTIDGTMKSSQGYKGKWTGEKIN